MLIRTRAPWCDGVVDNLILSSKQTCGHHYSLQHLYLYLLISLPVAVSLLSVAYMQYHEVMMMGQSLSLRQMKHITQQLLCFAMV
jgi:hypothetical protein